MTKLSRKSGRLDYKSLPEPWDFSRHGVVQLKTEESAKYRHPLKDAQWNQTLNDLRVELSARDGDALRALVDHIGSCIDWLDSLMNRYCESTCPICREPCCEGKGIFFNLTDMIFLAALDSSLPPGQTRTSEGEPCRYLSLTGCLLPRRVRPYVCVWFLCDPQMQLLQEETVTLQRHLIRVLQEIRRCRLLLEALYEQKDCPPG